MTLIFDFTVISPEIKKITAVNSIGYYIKLKKHGNRAKSIFKYGLSFIASVLLNAYCQTDIDVFKFLSYT
jgi:flagellar biosynthesis protein FlhB